MAGYSGRSLPEKLGIKPDTRIAVIGGPPDLPIPRGRLRPDLDMIVFFTTKAADLRKRWPALTGALKQNGALWIGWPKKASGVATDMTDHIVREVALPTGWVDIKVCAIDDTWSGLKCVLRVELRR
jgi:hypothetical protein